nr:MAG TPA: hypothetical protein [Bacteriophage sp.]
MGIFPRATLSYRRIVYSYKFLSLFRRFISSYIVPF